MSPSLLDAVGLTRDDAQGLLGVALHVLRQAGEGVAVEARLEFDSDSAVPATLRRATENAWVVRVADSIRDVGVSQAVSATLAVSAAATAALLARVDAPAAGSPESRRLLETLFLTVFARAAALLAPPAADEVRASFRRIPGWTGPAAGEIARKAEALCSTDAWRDYRERAGRSGVFLHAREFEALAPGERWRAFRAGLSAWYDLLLFGLPSALGFGRANPYFVPARLVLRGWVGDSRTRRVRARGGVARALGRARLLRAVEAFWSGWNSRVTRIATRPLYRLLGGDRRPFRATFATFLFSALVLHPLWLTLLLAGAAAAARAWGAEGRALAALSHPVVWGVHAAAIGLYAASGLVVGAVKSARARRRATMPK